MHACFINFENATLYGDFVLKILKKENYHSKAILAIWKDYIDWKKRRKTENGFLKKILGKNNCHRIFESALGDGCDSVYLIKQGFDVTSNELDAGFFKIAQKNAREENVRLKVTGFDWREIPGDFAKQSFDAVLCLGNTLTYLFTKKDRLKTLKNFYRVLRSGGVLIADERNYQFMLDNKEKVLKNDFKFGKKVVYCGEKVDVKPVFVSERKVILEYRHIEKGLTATLAVYPFKENELLGLLKETGFKKIEQYSDFKKGKNKGVDFFTYVAHK